MDGGVNALPRSGDPSWDGHAFDLDDVRIPVPIRTKVQEMATPGCTLYFADTDEGGEWWLLDADGELVEAFWLE